MIYAITGAVVLLLVALLVIIFFKRSHRRKAQRYSIRNNLIPMGPSNELRALRTTIEKMVKENTEFSPKKQFEELELNDERRATHQHCKTALKYTSKVKTRCLNAFPDVIPYESTRVILKTKIKGTNYINASWLNKAEREGPYAIPTLNPYIPFSNLNIITTQNPMSHTKEHYYQMLYENYITVVVSFCTRQEFGSKELYSDIEEEISKLKIKLSPGKLITPFLAQRNVEIHHSGDNSNQNLRIFQFVDWPDFGLGKKTNDCRDKFLSAISLMRKMIGKDKTTTNMVVQDGNGGVGGAAVFVVLLKLFQAVDESIDNANPEGELSEDKKMVLNVFETVNCMRKKREKLVHTFAEYLFMIECLLDYVKEKPHFDNLSIDDFHESKSFEDTIYFTVIK